MSGFAHSTARRKLLALAATAALALVFFTPGQAGAWKVYTRDGDVFLKPLADGAGNEIVQLTRTAASESGRRLSSASMSLRIFSFTLTDETSEPEACPSPLWKKKRIS